MSDKQPRQQHPSVNLTPGQETNHGRVESSIYEKVNKLNVVCSNLQEKLTTVNQDLQKTNMELDRSQHLLDSILKNISEAIVFIDLKGILTIVNDQAIKLLQLKKESSLFASYWSLFSDDFFGFSMKEALNFGISHRLLYKSYPPKEFEISTHFFYEGAKETHGLMILLRDITEQQNLHLMTERTNRMKELGEMTAVVAHEIRNPLGGIRGYASLLYRDLSDEIHLQEMAGFIVDGTKQLEKLVTTILQYARPIQIKLNSIDLNALLRSVIRFIKIDPSFPKKIQIAAHIPDEPLLAPIDAEALKSALLNLIFNAFQAMPEGGLLTLSLLKQTHCCQITISDTGIGMGDELLKQLFSPFFTTKQKGNGLGLVETQKIIQAHRGTIEVRSVLNKGSTFTITLPLRRS